MTNEKFYKGKFLNGDSAHPEGEYQPEPPQKLLVERRHDPMTHEQLFSPETLQSLADEIVRRMPAHICSLTVAQQEFVRRGESRSVLFVNTVGAVVIAAGVSFMIFLLSLGIRIWAKSKGGE